ncbi:MAG: N-6 DNA methylase, partial [Prevotella sp.]|nr:N-6 DNA methylase [Prevotella sp.]
DALRNLNILCVRLVFCLYAEDAGIFGRHDIFHDYMEHYPTEDMRAALLRLFEVLNTPIERRSRYLKADLAAFPYTNGGLFAEEIDIPQFTDEIRDLLLRHASMDFDWSMISPTIFGGVFESTLNPVTRRSGGMHYTSIENIHKVIDPLFLNDYRRELQDIKEEKVTKTRNRRLADFQQRLASLRFFDPACGSGNFLTETYISLRRMENEVIKELYSSRNLDLFDNPIKVSINQFYGIEINDFAVTVATTALWISEAQMLTETERIISQDIDFLPLKSYANIHEGNSLTTDWETIVPKDKLNYIIGNPPFVGFTYMSKAQKSEMQPLFPNIKNLDYVCCWYKKANDFIKETNIECAFVSTNSITQGETVARFNSLLDYQIIFAYRSFSWNSEATLKAAVHCVIIGFSMQGRKDKYIYDGETKIKANNINGYLLDAPNIIVESRNKPLFNIPKMIYGNKPADGGFLIIEENDYESFINQEPNAKKFIRPFMGAVEFLHNKKRWCLWLTNATPSEIKDCPLVYERIKKCQAKRASSIAEGIRKFAAIPSLFAQRTQPENVDFLIVPKVSSENRRYVPMAYIKAGTIASDLVFIIPDTTLYHFGILESNVHMAWMRAVCGRLKSDYRYSKDIVYNNFPWPAANDEQRQKIERTAQAILDARAKYPDSSLADLYDSVLMPPELRKAHQDNDRAVMQAYGFSLKMTESDCVAALFKMYAEQTEK